MHFFLSKAKKKIIIIKLQLNNKTYMYCKVSHMINTAHMYGERAVENTE